MINLIERIEKLELDVLTLKRKVNKSYLPNQELKSFRNRLIKIIQSFDDVKILGLEEGTSFFTYSNLIDMIGIVSRFGNAYILLVGSQIDLDINLWDFVDNKYKSLDDLFDSFHIKLLYDQRINTNEAYLIAMKTKNQKMIDQKAIVKFKRV